MTAYTNGKEPPERHKGRGWGRGGLLLGCGALVLGFTLWTTHLDAHWIGGRRGGPGSPAPNAAGRVCLDLLVTCASLTPPTSCTPPLQRGTSAWRSPPRRGPCRRRS